MKDDKLLAVMGSPGSGKTTTAIKIAQSIAAKRKNVIIVFLDPFTPIIPYILPAHTIHEVSLGQLFTAPSVTQKQVLDACIPVPECDYISLLGYRAGESLIKYPQITKERVIECLILLRHLADYVILDCTTVFEADSASIVAMENSDMVLYMATASLKGVSYYQSHRPLLKNNRFQKDNRLMAIGNLKVGQDWEAVSGIYGGVEYVLPNIGELEQQENELSLFSPLKSSNSTPYQLTVNRILAGAFSLVDEAAETKKRVHSVVQKDKNKLPGFKGLKIFNRKGEF